MATLLSPLLSSYKVLDAKRQQLLASEQFRQAGQLQKKSHLDLR